MGLLQHPYLGQAVPETNHLINKEGKAACEASDDLCPGHNCCAVCAAQECSQGCPTCGKVHYCNVAHAMKDEKPHSAVCQLLSYIAEAADIEVTADEEQQHLAECLVTYKELQEAGSWEDVLPADVTTTSPESSDVLDEEQTGAEEEEGERPSKRARVIVPADTAQLKGASHDQEPASTVQVAPTSAADDMEGDAVAGIAADGALKVSTEEAPAAEAAEVTDKQAEVAQDSVDPELVRAVQLAISSSYLSYPYTLGACLGSVSGIKQVVQGLGSDSPLVVLIMGASENAELHHMEIWKSLQGASAGGVILQMVGPEVPLSRHLQVTEVAPGVQATFYKGEYKTLVDHVLMVPAPAFSTIAPPSTSAAAAAEPVAEISAAPEAGAVEQQGKMSASSESVLPALLRALPDIIVGYNQGLTCPDYDWQPTIKALRRVFKAKCDAVAAAPAPTSGRMLAKNTRSVCLPWLQTTNTQMEALMEEELVRHEGWSVAKPAARNPFTSLEPLQSGTLANDLYRKNAWVAVYELRARVAAGKGSRRGGLLGLFGAMANSVKRMFTGKRKNRQ